MRRFDRDEQLNPIGFGEMAALMGLAAEQKYSKSYSASAKAIPMYCPPEHVQGSLARLYAMDNFVARTQHPEDAGHRSQRPGAVPGRQKLRTGPGFIISRAIHSEAIAQNFHTPRHSVGASEKAPL